MPHSVDAAAKVVITSDGQFRRGKPAPLKEAADQAVADSSTIEWTGRPSARA